jgi:hypothetical protein
MRFKKSVAEQDPTTADLVDELVRAVHDQIEEDGSARTPAFAADERRQTLTERWKGARLVAAAVEDGTASIHKQGVDHEVGDGAGDTWIEAVEFPSAQGRIKAVSPSQGGWIELTNGTDICLGLRGEDGIPLPDQELGLELSLR